ncbi:MAG: RHS repeat-associated core domain-containing protein [Anaerolineales bacterium]|nr:RHS repeat-associated core domain-containing protein [Anaerolineales bacterium]
MASMRHVMSCRYSSGTPLTKYTYTGQYSYVGDFGLHYYNARWYDSSLGRFAQADTIVPEESQGVQAWDRFAYVNNSPIVYNDPTGHCIILCIIAIGAVIGASVNVYTQYQETKSMENINWGEVAVAAGIGAVAGAVAAVIIVPAATAAGTTAAAYTGSTFIGIATELTLGSFMAGTSNVLLSNTQRAATDAIHGEQVTLSSITHDFNENYETDMFYGAFGYGVGWQLGRIGNQFWKPSTIIGNPNISNPLWGPGNLLNPNPTQAIASGIAGSVAETASNSTVLQSIFYSVPKKKGTVLAY